MPNPRSGLLAGATLMLLLCEPGCAGDRARAGHPTEPAEVMFSVPDEPERLIRHGPALAILVVADRRPDHASDLPLARWLPGMPMRSRHETRPERLVGLAFEPERDLAHALREHAAGAKLFRDVGVIERGGTVPPDAFRLELALERLELRETRWHYRLGALALPLWAIGAPLGETRLDLEIGARLVAPGSELVWEGLLRGERRRFVSLYANRDERRTLVADLLSLLRSEWLRAVLDFRPLVVSE